MLDPLAPLSTIAPARHSLHHLRRSGLRSPKTPPPPEVSASSPPAPAPAMLPSNHLEAGANHRAASDAVAGRCPPRPMPTLACIRIQLKVSHLQKALESSASPTTRETHLARKH